MADQDIQYIPLPEIYDRRSLNSLYREIPLKDSASRTLRKYFSAMANLYGIIPLRKAYEIISEQSPSLATEEEFLAFAEISRHECKDYCILGADEIFTNVKDCSPLDREIISVMLFDEDTEDMDLYLQTKQLQQGKPYYVPKKTDLLRYSDSSYCDDTPEAKALRDFIKGRVDSDDTEAAADDTIAETIFQLIYFSVRSHPDSLPKIIERMLSAEDVFEKSMINIEKFASLHQAFHNATRMQCNRGHTPNEIQSMTPPAKRVPNLISFAPGMHMPNDDLRISTLKEIAQAKAGGNRQQPPQKIGRNAPCPCGSGKKYKRCCGR